MQTARSASRTQSAVAVGGRVDGDRLDAQVVARADEPHRGLPAVRDQDPLEHRSGGLELEQRLSELDRLGVLDQDAPDHARRART